MFVLPKMLPLIIVEHTVLSEPFRPAVGDQMSVIQCRRLVKAKGL